MHADWQTLHDMTSLPMSSLCSEEIPPLATPKLPDTTLGDALTSVLLHAALYQATDLDEADLNGDEQFNEFQRGAAQGNLVPLFERLFSDQLTPVVAYRCLVREDDREAPSFLFESVVNGDQTVRLPSPFCGCQ